MTTIHTRHLQKYTQDNCNNTHKTTTTIHTRQLQQYTQDNYNNIQIQLQQYTQDNYNNTHKTTTIPQDNYNNTHKTIKTIHTRQLQHYTQENLKYNLLAIRGTLSISYMFRPLYWPSSGCT